MKIPRKTTGKYPAGFLGARIIIIAACWVPVAAFLLTGPGTSLSRAADRESLADKGQLNERLTPEQQRTVVEKNVRIRKLQEGIIDQKIKILDTKQKERTLLGELESIEQDLEEQKKLIADLEVKLDRQEILIVDKQAYLKEVLAEKKAHQAHVKNRLAAYYRMGSVGVVNIMFSTESLPDLLDFNEYFSLMVANDHQTIQEYISRIKQSNQAREDHAREKLRLMTMAEELNEKEERLSRIREEKNLLLKQVNTEQHLYNRAVSEIEEAVADLAATLQKIQSANLRPAVVQPPEKTETKKNEPPPDMEVPQGFAGQKGQLDPPVYGAVTNPFGRKIAGKFDSATVSQGIDILADEGSKITAIYDGKVIHSGHLRGYGNLMIIDHGQQYYSLVSRASEFYQKEGTRLTKGEIIGVTGEPDPLYGEGIHFEIRRGATPEDPLPWLRKDSLPGVKDIQGKQ